MSTDMHRDVSYTDRQRLEAAQWFVDVHETDDPSPELLQRWLRWLEASEGNRLAFEAIETAWHETPENLGEHLDPVGEAVGEAQQHEPDYDPTISGAEWQRQRARVAWRFSSGLRSRFAVGAATVVLLLVAGAWGLQHPELFTHPSSGEFVTGTGEHMQLVLADGSSVTLGARSKVSVGFTEGVRNVHLESGEAFFSVRKDSHRPFAVHALGGVITAVGTAFNVRTTADEVTVAVADGTVNVADAHSGEHIAAVPPEPVRVTRGEQLRFIAKVSAPALRDAKVTHLDPAQSARWRDGWLIYRDEPLRYVISDVSRYTDREIALGDSVTRDLRFTGAVFKDSVVEWVEALPEVFPVTVRTSSHGMTITATPASITAAAP